MEVTQDKNKLILKCACDCTHKEDDEAVMNGFAGDPTFTEQLDSDIYTKDREFFIYIHKEGFNEFSINALQEFTYSNFLTLLDTKEAGEFIIITFRCNEKINNINSNTKNNAPKDKHYFMCKSIAYKHKKPIEEIQQLVNEKCKELSGLISPQGAVYVVDNELNQKLRRGGENGKK